MTTQFNTITETPAPLLRISPQTIRAASPGNLAGVFWRQWWTERALRRRGIDFRTTDAAAAQWAYSAMTADEFDAINARQAWANWRTIGRSLDELLPDRPLVAVDLGCGSGESTRVLAHYLPPGSTILGIEFAAPLVAIARNRTLRHVDGSPAAVQFVVGSAAETFRDGDGTSLPSGSVDLVNASGLLAHHLPREMLVQTATEIARVLRPGGIAALDTGPHLSDVALTALVIPHGFERLRQARSHPLDLMGQTVFRRSPPQCNGAASR